MNKLILCIFILKCSSLAAQNFEFFCGLSYNNFRSYYEDEGHYWSSYTPAFGFAGGAGINALNTGRYKLKMTLALEQYGGSFIILEHSPGSDDALHAEVHKTVLSAGIYPVCYTFWDKLNLNAGVQVSGLLFENLKGTYSSIAYGYGEDDGKLSDMYDRYSTILNGGLIAGFSYDFRLSDKIILSPSYSYCFGLTYEFIDKSSFSRRHFIGIVVKPFQQSLAFKCSGQQDYR